MNYPFIYQIHGFKENINKKSNEMSEVAMTNDVNIPILDEKKYNKKKEFLKSFGKTINNGPLTFYEYSNCNQKLIDYIDDRQNTLQHYLNEERNS